MNFKFRKTNNQKELTIIVSERKQFPQYARLFNYCRKNNILLSVREVF